MEPQNEEDILAVPTSTLPAHETTTWKFKTNVTCSTIACIIITLIVIAVIIGPFWASIIILDETVKLYLTIKESNSFVQKLSSCTAVKHNQN